MTVELSLIVAVISLAFAVFSGVSSMKRGFRADSKRDASDLTTVMVKLENISNSVTEFKAEFKSEFSSIRADSREVRERVTIIEQSLKSAWHQIDELKERMEKA